MCASSFLKVRQHMQMLIVCGFDWWPVDGFWRSAFEWSSNLKPSSQLAQPHFCHTKIFAAICGARSLRCKQTAIMQSTALANSQWASKPVRVRVTVFPPVGHRGTPIPLTAPYRKEAAEDAAQHFQFRFPSVWLANDWPLHRIWLLHWEKGATDSYDSTEIQNDFIA